MVDLSESCQNLPELAAKLSPSQAQAFLKLAQDAARHVVYGKPFLAKLAILFLSSKQKEEFGIPEAPES
jgi:hypothetical protein